MSNPATPLNSTSPTVSLAQHLALFARAQAPRTLPALVRERARLHALDAIGLAFASHTQAFAAPSLAGIEAAGAAGPATVIGDGRQLAPRDAAAANGLLMHGLDFDDTHLGSIIHATVASLPAALAIGEQLDADWDDTLCAYAIGMEAAIRIGAAVNGGFHHVGFHATGVVSHFSSALVAGKLLGLDATQLCAAQGIAASSASGVQVFLEEGAWTKRLHPGWGALSGITAAHLAKAGFVAPTRPLEGRFGLFETHLNGAEFDPGCIRDDLGSVWNLPDTAIKPYPVCHFSHGCADAAVELSEQLKGRIDAIQQVTAWLPAATLPIVAEPAQAKQNVTTDYEAKFSAPFVVAMALIHGRFGLPELTEASLADVDAQKLTRKVICRADPDSAFPQFFSGGVTVQMNDGSVLRRHVRVNKGAGERALSAQDISAKFLANAGLHIGARRAQETLELLLSTAPRSTRSVMRALRKD